jgi:hypothetical protein
MWFVFVRDRYDWLFSPSIILYVGIAQMSLSSGRVGHSIKLFVINSDVKEMEINAYDIYHSSVQFHDLVHVQSDIWTCDQVRLQCDR